MSDILSALIALTRLAQAFDRIARTSVGAHRRRAMRDARQLRLVAQETVRGIRSTDYAWVWADTAAGQLMNDHRQIETRARARA